MNQHKPLLIESAEEVLQQHDIAELNGLLGVKPPPIVQCVGSIGQHGRTTELLGHPEPGTSETRRQPIRRMVGVFPHIGMTDKRQGPHHRPKDIQTPFVRHRAHDFIAILDEPTHLSRAEKFGQFRTDLVQNRLFRQLVYGVSRGKKSAGG